MAKARKTINKERKMQHSLDKIMQENTVIFFSSPKIRSLQSIQAPKLLSAF
jgi:hypothetical protein